MFKKPFKLQTQSLLKKSDARKFREQIKKCFNLSDEQLNTLIAVKDEVATRIVAGTFTLIYYINEQPLFFDPDGKDKFLPTVYALWRVPTLLPTLSIHAPVFKYIASGADLMLPGVALPEGGIDALGEFKKGDARSVILHENGLPVAVGYMDLGAMALKRQGMKGKAMQVLHYWRDQLWALGSKEAPPTLASLAADTDAAEAEAPAASTTAVAAAPPGVAEAAAGVQAMSVSEQKTETAASAGSAQPAPAAAAAAAAGAPADAASPSPAASATAVAAAPPAAAPDALAAAAPSANAVNEMDELLKTCFLQALKRQVKDKDLPMLFNVFYSSQLMACKPADANLDIRKSSYKKLSKFIEEMESLGLVKTAEQSPGVLMLTAINRDSPLYKSFQAAPKEKDEAKKNAKADNVPLVVELLKPHNGMEPLFEETKGQEYFKRKELQDILWAYVAEHSLSPKNSTTVILDSVLALGVYQKQKQPGDTVEKKDLLERVISRMVRFYQLNRDGNSEIIKGKIPTVHLRAAQRAGRKFITLATGLDGFGFAGKELDKLTSDLQRHFATSVSTQESPTGALAILVQGNVLDGLEEYLVEKLGIPRKCIEAEEFKKK